MRVKLCDMKSDDGRRLMEGRGKVYKEKVLKMFLWDVYVSAGYILKRVQEKMRVKLFGYEV